MDHLVLAGFMGTGKSTLGKRLSEKYSLSFIDLDQFIEDSVSMSIDTLFRLKGQREFRDIERSALKTCLSLRPQILSLGGGTLFHHSNVLSKQQDYKIVLLKCTYETIFERIKHSSRPLLKTDIRELYSQREAFQYAYDFTLSTDNRSIDDCCKLLRGYLNI